jgi:hypothetical protein
MFVKRGGGGSGAIHTPGLDTGTLTYFSQILRMVCSARFAPDYQSRNLARRRLKPATSGDVTGKQRIRALNAGKGDPNTRPAPLRPIRVA